MELSAQAKYYVRIQSISFAVAWVVWPLLLRFAGFFWMIMFVNLFLSASIFYGKSIKKGIEAEVAPNSLSFRRYSFLLLKIGLPGLGAYQFAWAILENRPLTWIITGISTIVGVGILVRDQLEIRELEAKKA